MRRGPPEASSCGSEKVAGSSRSSRVGEQAATRTEGTASRSGTYTYEKTGPRMGTVRLDYDDGASCVLRLSFTESGAGGVRLRLRRMESWQRGASDLTTGSLLVPVILSSAGRNNSYFTSELTLGQSGGEGGKARLPLHGRCVEEEAGRLPR